MNFATIDFVPKSSSSSKGEELKDVVGWFGSCLWKNGQIADDYQVAWCDGTLRLAVLAHGRKALQEKHLTAFGRDAMMKALEFVKETPRWVVHPTGRREAARTFVGAPSLYIETYYMDDSNRVVWRGDTHDMIPTYLLPLQEGEREWLSGWGNEYRQLDAIWLASGHLETTAYRQLAEVSSELNRTGRGLAALIEQATGIPTYLSLKRYYAFAEGEDKRRCPDCGKNWSNNPRKLPGPLLYEFRCRECHLISWDASAVESERLARIGLHPRDPLRKPGRTKSRRRK